MIRKAEGIEPPVQEAPETPTTANLYRIAWQRKSLVNLGLVICLVCGALYFAQKQPVYRSDASVLVIRKSPEVGGNLAVDPATYFMEDYLATHTIIIRSPTIVGTAVEKGELFTLPSFKNADPQTVVTTILENLTVSRNTREGTTRSSVLDLTYRGPVSDDSSKVLMHIIEAYRSYLAVKYRDAAAEVAKHLNAARDILNNQMQRARSDHKEYRLRNPFVDQRMDGRDPRKLMLANIEDTLAKLSAQRINKETRLSKIEKALESENWEAAQWLLTIEIAHRFGDPVRANSSMAMQEDLAKYERERRIKLTQAGVNHPDVKVLDEIIADIRGKINVAREQDGPPRPGAPKDQVGSSTNNLIRTGLATQRLELDAVVTESS